MMVMPAHLTPQKATEPNYLPENAIYCGDACELLQRGHPASVALSFWSPPYCVGKTYEKELTFPSWQGLLKEVIALHYEIIKPGGFLAINIADILSFSDPDTPRVQADNVGTKKVKITGEEALAAQRAYPGYTRYQLADLLGCSEQTVDRRLNNNKVREGNDFLTTIFVKYNYRSGADRNDLIGISIICLPNGMLQERYNPDQDDSFWRAGRNAPSLGEVFRVRIGLPSLKRRANWRAQQIQLVPDLAHRWDD